MRQHLSAGLAAAEAARLAKAAGGETAHPQQAAVSDPHIVRMSLSEALERFDEPAAQAVLDRAIASMTLDAVLAELVLPYLQELGTRWARGEVSIAQEHFASSVLRGRLLGVARGWGLGSGGLALLACLPGELHDLGLIAFGLALRARGWRIVYLGPDTPIETLDSASRILDPRLVVFSSVSKKRVRPAAGELRRLAARHQLAVGGVAAKAVELESLGVLTLVGDPVSEAERVAALV